MRLQPNEHFTFIPPTATRLWSITVRKADGTYRQPTGEELDRLRDIYESNVWRCGAADSRCVNRRYCDERDECCAGDPDCKPEAP